ncbi:MAG: alpha/beta hydrolase [Actinobacteria bacterium]|nr:alpha/beta hydrolase [Actinomycetota bacterium]
MTVASTNGVQIAVHDLGGSGRPLLISHATGFHGHCYEPLAHALADRFHSTAFDYRGHGDTDHPDQPVDWQRYGDDAEAMATWMVQQHGGPVDAFGHSMGGACLLMAAHRQPQLFRRLVLFEPIVFPPGGIRPADEGGNDPEQSPMVIGARRRRATFPSHQAAIDNFAAKPPLMGFTPEALRAYVVHGFAPDDDGVHLKCRPDTEAATFATGHLHDTWEVLPDIQTEVLVVAGRIDEMQPSKVAAGVAERLPHGTYLQIEQLDHFGPMVRPLLVADLIAEYCTRT